MVKIFRTGGLRFNILPLMEIGGIMASLKGNSDGTMKDEDLFQ